MQFLLDETDDMEALIARLVGDNGLTQMILRRAIDPQWRHQKIRAPRAPKVALAKKVVVPPAPPREGVAKIPAKRPRDA